MEIHVDTHTQRHKTTHNPVLNRSNDNHAHQKSDGSRSSDHPSHIPSPRVRRTAAHVWWLGMPEPMRAAAVGTVVGAVVGITALLTLSLLQSTLTHQSDAADHSLQGSALGLVDPECGLDGMKAYKLSSWGKRGTPAQVYGSCDLCGLSANGVQAMLALSHDCQRDVWLGNHWATLESVRKSSKEEEPVCIVVCSSLVPCFFQSPNKTSPVGSSQETGGGWSLPSCLLSMWVRKGTSDSDVVHQMFFDKSLNSLKALQLPSPRQLPIRTVLDAGANIGLMSVYFATLYPGAIIVSMEVSSSNYDMLVRNTARFLNVRPLQRALWSSATTLCLVHGHRNADIRPEWAFQVFERSQVPAGREILDTMQSKSVTDVLKMFGLQSFDLIKMDVEGSEGAVFAEGSDVSFLEHARMAVVELHGDMWKGAPFLVHSAFAKYPRWRLASSKGEHDLWLANSQDAHVGHAQDRIKD